MPPILFGQGFPLLNYCDEKKRIFINLFSYVRLKGPNSNRDMFIPVYIWVGLNKDYKLVQLL